MKKAIFWALVPVAALALVANAQVPLPPTPIPASTADAGFIQFNNLVVTSVSGTQIPAEIVANYPMLVPMMGGAGASGEGSASAGTAVGNPNVRCYGYSDANSGKAVPRECPTPAPSASGTVSGSANTSGPASNPVNRQGYRIEVDASTKLYLRDRTPATLSDFAPGDEINVFGYYNADGSVQAYVVRDLSKPVEEQFIQLNNVDVVSISGTSLPATLVVATQFNNCIGFGGGGGTSAPQSIVCPPGLMQPSANSATAHIEVPSSLMPIWQNGRKYVVTVDANTILLDRNRTRLSLSDLKVGDSLNVYGGTSDNGQTIAADIVRDLSIPVAATTVNGSVSQVNADGSFVIATQDGRTITVQAPITVGAQVQIRGMLDRLKNVLSQITNIVIGKVTPTPFTVPPVPATTNQ